MPANYKLSKRAIGEIHDIFDEMFDNLKARLFAKPERMTTINIGVDDTFSIPGIFDSVSEDDGQKTNKDSLNTVIEVATSYLDATRESAKAQAINAIQSTMRGASAGSLDQTFYDSITEELDKVFNKVTSNVDRIVVTETQNAKNFASLDSAIKLNAQVGNEDPVVFWIVVKDRALCEECRRLHLMPDGKTPRLWYLSEVGHDYHKRGEENPKIGGLHPHCRCTMVTLLPGYGFSPDGTIKFVAIGHQEIDVQRGKKT